MGQLILDYFLVLYEVDHIIGYRCGHLWDEIYNLKTWTYCKILGQFIGILRQEGILFKWTS